MTRAAPGRANAPARQGPVAAAGMGLAQRHLSLAATHATEDVTDQAGRKPCTTPPVNAANCVSMDAPITAVGTFTVSSPSALARSPVGEADDTGKL